MGKILLLSGITAVVLVTSAWFFFFRGVPAENPMQPSGGFGTGASQAVEVTPPAQNNEVQTTNSSLPVQQIVFRVVNGPIVGATVVQYTQPTTTVARYVQQNNGHVFDLVLDSSGAVPKAISNTTIPGISRALWTRQGQGVILQYLDRNVVKTVSLSFPQQATTSQAVNIKFLPDGISDIAVSPNGANVVYLLRTETGTRGYLAGADGAGSRELFTLPLREVVVSWPSQATVLTHTKSAAGVPGVAFSINTSSGAAVPLLHATGLSIAADPSYSYLMYQTNDGNSPSTRVRTISTGQSSGLSFDPYPERCVWGSAATSILYCAAPLEYVAPNYLDLWHAGSASAAEALFSFTFPGGKSSILAAPGGGEGGVESTIDTLSVSPDGRYLLFVKRGERSLWGVRL